MYTCQCADHLIIVSVGSGRFLILKSWNELLQTKKKEEVKSAFYLCLLNLAWAHLAAALTSANPLISSHCDEAGRQASPAVITNNNKWKHCGLLWVYEWAL